MKKYLRLITSLLLFVPMVSLATTSLVNAESSTPGSNSSSSSAAATTSSDSGDTESPTDSSLLQRLSTRKADLKTSLTTAQEDRIKLKCKVAQGAGINTLERRVKLVVTNRTSVYKDMLDRLTNLETKLKAKNVDTSTLDSQLTTLKAKITKFETDLTVYRQALVDLKSMNCTGDPTAFKASLEAARTLRQTAAADAADIRTYVNGTIKPTLVSIKTQLAQDESSTSKTSTTGGSQ